MCIIGSVSVRSSTNLAMLHLVFLIAGCGRYYYQEGKTFYECESGWARCIEDLHQHKKVLDWGVYE